MVSCDYIQQKSAPVELVLVPKAVRILGVQNCSLLKTLQSLYLAPTDTTIILHYLVNGFVRAMAAPPTNMNIGPGSEKRST